MERDYKLVDVSHTVEHGMVTYKGLPTPVITDHLTREASKKLYASGTEFQIGNIQMVANTGTYLDSPFHRYVDGTDLAGLDLASLANLDGVVVRRLDSSTRATSKDALTGLELHGKAVLFHTGWDVHWRTENYSNGSHPYLPADAAEYLAQSGATLVGIDSYNIDDTRSGERPAHSILLRHGIPVVEHLCGLNELPDQGFRFFAVPVKVKGMGTFPVRAFGLVPV
ncbi:MAG TPA: cyclase family protein [Pyrinomonadaceae bacterium]|nr:cyclase family protein [Pyrinomonadaceae bacterium]